MGLLEQMSSWFTASQQPPQVQPGAQTNTTLPAGTQTANKSDGNTPGIPAAPAGEKDPLANFASLWKIDDKDKSSAPSLTPNIAIDPTKLAEIAGKMDFTQGLPQELVAKAAGGDGASMIQVMNMMNQAAFSRGLQAAGQLTTNAFTSHDSVLINHTIPNSVQAINSRAEVGSVNSVLANPAVAPMADMVREHVTRTNPNATPAQIAEHVNNMFTTLSSEFLKQAGVNVDLTAKTKPVNMNTQQPNKVSDWVNWLDTPVAQ